MEEVLLKCDKVIADMTENLQDFAHLGSNQAPKHGHQGHWTEINASYTVGVDYNIMQEIFHDPKRCTNKMLQTCDTSKTRQTPPKVKQLVKTRSSSDCKDLDKLADLVADKLKQHPTLPRKPDLIPGTPSDSRRGQLKPSPLYKNGNFDFNSFKQAPEPRRLSPFEEFESILNGKDVISEAKVDLVNQLKEEDLDHLLSPEMMKLNGHLVQVQYRAELLNIQSRALMERGETAEISQEQQRIITDLEQKLTDLLRSIDLNLHQ